MLVCFTNLALYSITDAFFIECGALDGELFSNTLFFERERNWTGLLIEANEENHKALSGKNRNVAICKCCLSPVNEMREMTFFYNMGGSSGLSQTMHPSHLNKTRPKTGAKTRIVQCFPFEYLMEALGRKHVHFFSLDIEGGEIGVLKTIPFSEITIDILMIEFKVWGNRKATKEKEKQIRSFFRQTGLYHKGMHFKNLDLVFVRRGIEMKLDLSYLPH